MKLLRFYCFALILFFGTGCKAETLYTVSVKNLTTDTVGKVRVIWGNDKDLGYGGILKGTGKEAGLVYAPKGKVVLSYKIGDDEIKKEIDVMSKIPKGQAGRIIINIRENGIIDVGFKKSK